MNEEEQKYLQKTKKHPEGEKISFTSDGEIKSRRYSDTWDLSGVESRAVGKKSIVSFTKVDPRYRLEIQDTLADLYDINKDKNAKAPTSSQLNSWKIGLNHIACALDSTEWNKLDNRQGLRVFKSQLKKMELGEKSIENHVNVALNKLFEGEFIQYVAECKSLISLAKKKGVLQYTAIPIGMYRQLVEKTLSIVEVYHLYSKEITRVVREADDIKDRVMSGENAIEGYRGARNNTSILSMDPSAVSSRVRSARKLLIKHEIPNFSVNDIPAQLGLIQNSCAMVALSFSGARVGEMLSFCEDSYGIIKTDGGKEISVLHGETSKGNDGKPKPDTWQTHPITKDALELAFDSTESLREYYKEKIESMAEEGILDVDDYEHALKEIKSAFITINKSLQKTTFVNRDFALKFNALMKSFDIRATEEDVEEFNLLNPSKKGMLKVGGYLPNLTPHDFRRTFAVFMKRYGFGNASTIKFQYKHENINMSDYYANNAELMRMHDVLMDNELLEMMEEEGISLGVDIYDDIYNGSKHLSGVGGDRIAEDKFKKMKGGHDVYMSRTEIDVLIRNGSLAAVQLPSGGYCTNGECERICGMQLFIAEKKPCIHKVETDKTAKLLARQRKRLIGVFRGMNTEDTLRASMLVGLKQKIKEIEVTLGKHEIKFDAFEDKVRGLINVSS
jgi:integrase